MKTQQRINFIFQNFLLVLALVLSTHTLRAQCSPANPGTLVVSGTDWNAYAPWGLSAAAPIDQHLVIASGTTLDLDGVNLFLAEGITITVEVGARLTFRNCHLNSCDPDLAWEGIKIMGTTSLPADDHGQGKFGGENSTFENMRIGIETGVAPGTRGGWLYLVDCTIKNPAYTGVYVNAAHDNVPIFIRDNTFTNDKQSDWGTIWGNHQNAFMRLNYFCGKKISGNYFENVFVFGEGSFARMHGISTYYSSFTLDDNRFYHLREAVRLVTNNSEQCDGSRMTITNNQFADNYYGVYANAAYSPIEDEGLYIADNDFIYADVFNASSTFRGNLYTTYVGIDLYESGHAHIEGNTFSKVETNFPYQLPLNFVGIELRQSEHCAIRKNTFDLELMTDPTVIGLNTYDAKSICVSIGEIDDILIECNDFNLDPNSNLEQRGLLIFSAPLISAIEGINGVGSKNTFTQNPVGCPTGDFIQVYLGSTQPPLTWPAINSIANPLTSCSTPGKLLLQPGAPDNDCIGLNKHFDDYINSPYKTAPALTSTIDAATEMNVYPNPVSSNHVTVALPHLDGETQLEVYSMDGVRQLVQQTNQVETLLDIQGLAAGIYLLKASQPNHQVLTKKLVVK